MKVCYSGSYEDFCSGEPYSVANTGFWLEFIATGMLCVITNTEVTEEVSALTIAKSCLSGDGDGDADFNILVTRLEETVGADVLDCNEVMVLADLPAGLYTIHELITGPDAGSFQTAIVCTTESGQTVTQDSAATIVLEAGVEMDCVIANVFQGVGGGGEEPGTPLQVIVPIDIENTNDNALDNENLNDNNNENANTQEQSNEQEQTNDNNQVTNVNSSPSVVIDFE